MSLNGLRILLELLGTFFFFRLPFPLEKDLKSEVFSTLLTLGWPLIIPFATCKRLED